jgi:hypothetical protein
MLAIAAALPQHELPPKVQIRLILIMAPAAQRDIAHPMLATFSIGLFVMKLYTPRASTATTLLIDERATTTVT